MSFLLDTNAVIAILNERSTTVRERWRRSKVAGHDVVTSSIVLFELSYGAHKSAKPRKSLDRLQVVLSAPLDVLAFELEDAHLAGEIRAQLAAQGKPIGPYDLLIAGQALRRGLTVVTANTHEFQRVHGLKVENWELP